MSERVPAPVHVPRRIRELTNPHAIQHDPENSLEFPHTPAPQAPLARTVPHCLPSQSSAPIPALRRGRASSPGLRGAGFQSVLGVLARIILVVQWCESLAELFTFGVRSTR